ncbi:ASPIC/UnbV domain protein (plasmid) [Granulicella tundricola MP5ACTX9]|uniref:ASPIC/UnbV domain protein n=2 Tax=Granulicella TaxID=940557 RepID=E8X6W2_GRATM|nr:ASPIC/UnbV domain protein [Granulicella tundricola MP5ACTX9]
MVDLVQRVSTSCLWGVVCIVLSGSVLAQSPPRSAMPDKVPSITFENTLKQSKIDFILKSSISPQRYSIETMTGGVAAFDYDNDGLLDLFFTNGAAIPSLEKTDASFSNRLFHNNGDGTFTDVTVKAGVAGLGYSMGVAAGDFDHDGYEDLYVTGVNHNQLLHNNGNGTFTDVTAKAGVLGNVAGVGKSWAVTAGWFDYNNDGLLDLLVVNYLNYDIKTAASCSEHKIITFCSPDDFKGLPNILYKNNGDGTFTDVSIPSHIADYTNKGMGVAFADYDGDGRMDIFVSNDTFPNLLLHNNGDGTFTDEALNAGVAYNEMGRTVAGMGAEFRDLDNDGRPDIFHTAMFGDSFPLYKNLGEKQFDDATSSSGLTAPTSRMTAWGVGAYDFDNDGYKDLFTANSAILDNSLEVEHRPFLLPNSLYRNLGNLRFADVSASAGGGFSVAAAHRGAAFGDFNNDGRVDIAVTVLNGSPEILMNHTVTQNHWLMLKLVGVKDNRDGLGTKVTITSSHGSQYNQATTTVGYNSSSDKRVHFGLGDATVVDRIELSWPTGIKQVLTHVKADQILTVTESSVTGSRGEQR